MAKISNQITNAGRRETQKRLPKKSIQFFSPGEAFLWALCRGQDSIPGMVGAQHRANR